MLPVAVIILLNQMFFKKQRQRSRLFKIIFWLFLAVSLGGISYGSFFAYKIYFVGKKISIANENDSSFLQTLKSFTSGNSINLKSSSGGRINILLLGIAGKGKPGQNLTDTLMIASFNQKTGQVAFLSLPRDLYATISGSNLQTKINSVYQYGLNKNQNDPQKGAETIVRTIEDITSLKMNYYAILNFDGFEKIINSIGGINIMNERDIYDPRYPGPNYSYETFELKKGFHHLDGATALKYARERHDDPEGDFGRAKRQQQIIQATKNKIFSAGTLLNPFALNKLFDALGENIVTDVRPDEISDFLELAKKLDTQNINNVVVDAWNKDSLLKVAHMDYGGVRAFSLVPRVGNFSEIQELAQNVFDLNKIKRKRAEIAKEDARVALINQSGEPTVLNKIKKLLAENLDYKNIAVLENFNKSPAPQSTVHDLTDGRKPFTADELAAKLPAAVSYRRNEIIDKALAGKNADIVIVIGKDLVEKYNMEEGTLEDLNKARDDQESAAFNKS